MGLVLNRILSRHRFVAMVAAVLSFTSCTKTAPPPPALNSEALARSVVLCLLTEHEPDQYPPDVRSQADVTALAATYARCDPEQKAAVRKFVRGFLDYEDSQFADCGRWYGSLEHAVLSGDAASRGLALRAEVLTDSTKAIVASLPPLLRQLAEYQAQGVQSMPGILQSNLPADNPEALSRLSAVREAAAKFDSARKESYAKTYRRITQDELFRH